MEKNIFILWVACFGGVYYNHLYWLLTHIKIHISEVSLWVIYNDAMIFLWWYFAFYEAYVYTSILPLIYFYSILSASANTIQVQEQSTRLEIRSQQNNHRRMYVSKVTHSRIIFKTIPLISVQWCYKQVSNLLLLRA